MARTGWLLMETSTGYRLAKAGAEAILAEVAVSRGAEPDEIAAAVQQTLHEQGYHGEPTVLALASQSTLAATVEHTGRSMARSHHAMSYALEELLPLAAEETACDFVPFDHRALGVAVEVSTLRPVLSALEQSGVRVVSIVPVALLALQQQVEAVRPRGRRIVVWQEDETLDLFELINGKPHGWRTIPASPEALQREITICRLGGGVAGLRRTVGLEPLRWATGGGAACGRGDPRGGRPALTSVDRRRSLPGRRLGTPQTMD